MEQKLLDKICLYANKLNKGDPLNGDDIDDINKALKIANGD